MANVDKPAGLKPVGHMINSTFNGKVNIYYHSASDATAIYKGDLVQVDQTNEETTGKYPAVKQHVAGQEDNVGVAVGFGTTPYIAANVADLNAANYCPASTEMYVAVVDDPNVIFEIQEDSVGAALAADDVGDFADIIVGSGSTSTGTSGMEIDSSSAAHDTAATLRLLRLANKDDNAIGDHAKWLVLINEHLYNHNENQMA